MTEISCAKFHSKIYIFNNHKSFVDILHVGVFVLSLFAKNASKPELIDNNRLMPVCVYAAFCYHVCEFMFPQEFIPVWGT